MYVFIFCIIFKFNNKKSYAQWKMSKTNMYNTFWVNSSKDDTYITMKCFNISIINGIALQIYHKYGADIMETYSAYLDVFTE